jgi:hypothetical protein
MNMPLFVRDIKAMGCDFECICVAINKLKDLKIYIRKKKFDLIAVDYIFPIMFLNELKRMFPKARLVVGGSGFLDTFLKSEIDFAIIGAGREGFLRLVGALKNKSDIYEVPNLFLKINKNNKILIDYSGKNINFDLKRELFPYEPFLKWRYIGFKGGNKMNYRVAVVAEFGCPHRLKKLNKHYDNLSMEPLSPKTFTERARKRIEDLFRERMRGGCSFCTYHSYVSLSIEETIACLMKQIIFLQGKYGFKRFSIESENPFRFIIKLINQMLKENIAIEEIAIRSRVDLCNKNRRILHGIINLAKKYKFNFCLRQLGFESLCQKDLDIYNKGYTVTENLNAIKLISRLKEIAPRHFKEEGHGVIGINPWITLRDLEDYLESIDIELIRRLPQGLAELAHSFYSDPRLVLYDRCLPIYQKLKKEGMLVKRRWDLDTYNFKDKRVARFLKIISKIDLLLSQKYLSSKRSYYKYSPYKKILIELQKSALKKIKRYPINLG